MGAVLQKNFTKRIFWPKKSVLLLSLNKKPYILRSENFSAGYFVRFCLQNSAACFIMENRKEALILLMVRGEIVSEDNL